MLDVFISYSADARKWAERRASLLRGEGIATWSDFENLRPGERSFKQLQQALDEATFYLVVVGSRNLVGDWQDLEWRGALERTWTDRDKRIIPVLVGHAEPPAFLRNWAPLRLDPGRNEAAVAKKLADLIKTPTGSAPEPQRLGSDWRKRIREIESAAKRMKSRQEPSLAKEH